jgi:hypothetical protein
MRVLIGQVQENFHAPDDSLIISGIENFSKLSLNFAPAEHSMAGTGHPVHILMNTMGLTLEAPFVDVTAKQNADLNYYVTDAHTKNGTKAVIDSQSAAAFDAKTGKKPPVGTYRFLLTTASLDYPGSQTRGDMTVSSPFDANGHTEGTRTATEKGKPVKYAFIETFAIRGSSGKLQIDPTPGVGVRTIQSGTFQGPIAFSADRTETKLDVPAGTKPDSNAESSMHLENGQCDSVDIVTDADGETITLKGHVRFDFDSGHGMVPVRNGELFTIRLDPNLALMSVHGVGSPLETSVSIRPAKQ